AGTINLCAAVLDEDVFRQCFDVLNASTLEIQTFENTYIEGSITCDRNGILYTSIPQDGNWHATVDGRPVQTVL
ncbi:YfhO family protein, partial [Salmonella enterica]|uniref:YfhO family protein n=1 Tax=Salmonella enterica TaxID=28901 RepID=UPI003CEA879E